MGGTSDPPVVSGAFSPLAAEGVLGLWSMDDCSTSSTVLADTSGAGANAQRTNRVTCAEGIDGKAVEFDENRDRVEAAGSGFAIPNQVTLAAWVRPSGVRDGVIAEKRAGSRSVLSLALNRGTVSFTIELSGRRSKAIKSRAPIAANVWTHVAGQYDGRFVRLFLNGEQVGQVAATGTINDASGSMRMGEGYKGRLDNVFVSSARMSLDEVLALSCLRRPSTLDVLPITSGPVDPDTQVTYSLTVTNNNLGGCGSAFFFPQLDALPDGFSASLTPDFSEVLPGQSTSFALQVTGTVDATPGAHNLVAQIFGDGDEPLRAEVEYILNEPSGCVVSQARELMIRDLSVVEDRLRTVYDRNSADPRSGVWSFGRLMENLAPSAAQAPAMVEALFRTWLTNQTINGFTVAPRTLMQELVLDLWPRNNGELDLARPPLRLLAIVNRVDIRNLANGHAGEGRFVFGVLNGTRSEQFTLILEYRLPARTEADVHDWAARWHALGGLALGSEAYNAALQAITDRFSGRNAEPGRPNGSALGQLRTNEIALEPRWELREFELAADGSSLRPATVKLTPDTSFRDENPLVAAFVNENEDSILIEQHTVPEEFQGQRFLGGSSLNDLIAWRSSGITNNEARHKFSLNTCNGCHSDEETRTPFLMINPRERGMVSALSPFLTGVTLPDPVTQTPRTLNDLQRRTNDLKFLVCPSPARARVAATGISVAKGIGRVH